jgi:hypothetical protein
MNILHEISHHLKKAAELLAEAAKKEAEAQAELARKAEEAVK